MDESSRQLEGLDLLISMVVGLGNPGRKYSQTRHNAGFQVVDRLAAKLGIPFRKWKARASYGVGILEGRRIVLVKPLTFMNRSGEVVPQMLKFMNTPAEQMLVIHDDLDLANGRIRLVPKGGAGGHQGVRSIIQHLGHQEFPRMKLGIGRPQKGEPVEQYVLQAPYPEQKLIFEEMIARGVTAAEVVLSAGLETGMNRFNRQVLEG